MARAAAVVWASRFLRAVSHTLARVDRGKQTIKNSSPADDVSRRIGTAGVDAGDKIIRHRDEIGAADDVQAGSVLDQVYHLVDHGRQDDLDALGQNDIVHPPQIAKALGLCRFRLSLGDGLDTGADHLGHISPVVDSQSDHAGGQDADAVA